MHRAEWPLQFGKLTWGLHGQGKTPRKAPPAQQGAGPAILRVAKGSIRLCIWKTAPCSLHSPTTLQLSAKPFSGRTCDAMGRDDALMAGAQVELTAVSSPACCDVAVSVNCGTGKATDKAAAADAGRMLRMLHSLKHPSSKLGGYQVSIALN